MFSVIKSICFPKLTLRLPQHVQAYINKLLFVLPPGTECSALCCSVLSRLSLGAVLQGALALLTAVQQLEQLNTIHDPPAAVQRIPNPSYLVLQTVGFHSHDIKEKGRFFTANEAHFNDAERNNVDGTYPYCACSTWTWCAVIKGFIEN